MRSLWLGSIKRFVPPSLRRWMRLTLGWRWFRGDYPTWTAARSASYGYDDAPVLGRVAGAARAARDGLAAWDRDGATFAQPHMHAPLLAALRESARVEGGRLHLVDFGGGLGGTWRQYSPGLSDLADVRWSVVEQPHFADVGRREFADTLLNFQPTLAKAQSETAATVVLFSSVLQYVPDPHALLAEAVRLGFRHVIIDRTSFWNGGRDRLTVQFTPPELGGGSYPCWLFDQVRLLAPLSETHERVSEWPGFDDVDARVQFHGMYFKRKLAST